MWKWVRRIGIVALGIAGVALITAAFTVTIPVTLVVIGGGAVVGSICLGIMEYRGRRERDYQSEIARLNIRIAALEAILAENDGELETLRDELTTLRQNNTQLTQSLTQAQNTVNQLQANIDAQNTQLQRLRREKADLEFQLAQQGGGNGIKSSLNYAKYYYTSKEINTSLQAAVTKRLGGYQQEIKFLLNATFKDQEGIPYRVMLLPAVFSGNAIRNLHHNSELCELLNQELNIKLLFPFLDLERQHWCTVEINISKCTSSKYQVDCMLHDPRGGGQISTELLEELRSSIVPTLTNSNKNTGVEFLALPSPYQSCRQSKVDKISCGPIVVNEIELRIKGQNLDRYIPYQFGASELVTDQQQNINNELIEDRYQFLTNLSCVR